MNDFDFDHINLKIDIGLIENDMDCEDMLRDIRNVLKKYNYKQVVRDTQNGDSIKVENVEFYPDDVL